MKKKMNRREFLKVSTSGVLGSIALTACGSVFPFVVNAKETDIIEVGDDNLVTDIESLKENIALNFNYQGKRSVLLYNDGDIKAFENICTHKGGPSNLMGEKLVCQWHGATFSPMTGEAIGRPAPEGSRLPEIKLEIKDMKIYIA